MKLIEWEVNEDNYQEQIIIPEAKRKLAESVGISTENKQKVAVRIQNLNTDELYSARLTRVYGMVPGPGRHTLLKCYFIFGRVLSILKKTGWHPTHIIQAPISSQRFSAGVVSAMQKKKGYWALQADM